MLPWHESNASLSARCVSGSENVFAYPKPDLFDKMDLPTYGLYVRHVENITFDNVKMYYTNEDVRPAPVFDDIKDFHISNTGAKSNASTMPAVFWHVTAPE